jgi:hypothetical protein
MPPEGGLLPLLALATYNDHSVVEELQAPGLKVTSVEFWPTYHCDDVADTEPDVVIELEDGNAVKYTAFVEVKLRSGKSSRPIDGIFEIRDQLARQWCILIEHCANSGSRPCLLYVTADPRYPLFDVEESAREFAAKRPLVAAEHPFSCAWISWCHVATRFRDSERPALRDLSSLCDRLDLVPFQGVRQNCVPTLFEWQFSEKVMPFNFSGHPVAFTWSFK